jgi:hypothetical protein
MSKRRETGGNNMSGFVLESHKYLTHGIGRHCLRLAIELQVFVCTPLQKENATKL